jgi:phytoene dehydrogenase-like protein
VDYDAVFVGSGINCLVAASLLARDGWRCAVFERQSELGGAIQTTELVPGFIHDLYAVTHTGFVASDAYRELASDLRVRGLVYAHSSTPFASMTADGTSAVLTTDLDENVGHFERHASGDGVRWRAVCAEHALIADLVGELLTRDAWSRDGLILGLRAYRRLGRRGIAAVFGSMLETCRNWTAQFRSPATQALLAPWCLHAGVGPDDAASAFMARVSVMSQQARGSWLPIGGGIRLVGALARIVADAGGLAESGRGVRKILVEGGRATGVQLDDGTRVFARRAVVAGVTPTQLYGTLLRGVHEADDAARAARQFRYGRARMQVHMTLAEPPQWADERLLDASTVHVTSGVNGLSRAVNEAERGLLPAEPTLTISQPVSIDESRAPEGGWIFSIQLHETPWRPTGDAAAEIDVGNGLWTLDLTRAYADRAQSILSRHVPNLDRALVHRLVLSPVDMAEANENFVSGDGASGATTLDQLLLLRPRPELAGHATPVSRLYQVGASTHPGPGLAAGSGNIVARHLRGLDRRRFTVKLRRARAPLGAP